MNDPCLSEFEEKLSVVLANELQKPIVLIDNYTGEQKSGVLNSYHYLPSLGKVFISFANGSREDFKIVRFDSEGSIGVSESLTNNDDFKCKGNWTLASPRRVGFVLGELGLASV